MLLAIAKLSIALQCIANGEWSEFHRKMFSSKLLMFPIFPAQHFLSNNFPDTTLIIERIVMSKTTLILSDPPIKNRVTIDASSSDGMRCIGNTVVRWIPKVKST